METNVSALYVSLFVEGPAVEFLDGDPEVIVLVESKNDMRMGATYVTLMKFLVSSTDGFVGGNLHLSRTPGSRTWGKKSVLLLSLDQSPQLDSLLIHCDRGRLEFSIIPNFPNCRPDCSVMLIL